MNILQVIPYFNPMRGGVINVCVNLSKYLVMKGHKVSIITSDFEFDTNYAYSIEKLGIDVIPFHCSFNIGLFIYTPGLRDWLEAELTKYDIVHLHEFQSYQNNVIYPYSIKRGVPYVLQAHGLAPIIMNKSILKRMYNMKWGNDLLRNASRVIALTTREWNEYKEMGLAEDKIRLIPNGLDFSEYFMLPKKGTFREKYGINDDEKVILFLGRLHRIKGIDLLLESFVYILKEFPDAKLILAGPDYGELDNINRLIRKFSISKNVIIPGAIFGEDKLSAYIDADVFVLSSSYETFPLTILESCYCGTPVVMTNRCGLSDIVHNKMGLCVDFDSGQVRDSISILLRDEVLRSKFANYGKKIVKDIFNLEKIVTMYGNMYEELIVKYK